MTLSRETRMELMALADGELEGAAKERAEQLLERSAEAREMVASVRDPALRTWLGEALSGRSAAAGIADAVMARIEREPSPSRRPAARSRRGREARWAAPGVGSKVAVVAALAVAAGVALFVVTDRMAHVATGAAGPAASLEGAGGGALASASLGVEVEEVDSASRVSIFEIPAMAKSSTPSSVVVWIDDDAEQK